MSDNAKLFALASLLLLSACTKAKNPCDDKMVVLKGDGPTEVISQWEACVARNASELSSGSLDEGSLARTSIELCKENSARYALALVRTAPTMENPQVDKFVKAYQSGLFGLAISEVRRARKLGCVAK